MPPLGSPTRRVLGEKDTNASLHVTSPRKNLKANIDSRPVLQPPSLPRNASGAIKVVPASPRAGQKRSISEVEGVETQDWSERIEASQATDVVSDSASETDQMETSMLSTRSAGADTTMTSFGVGASQENMAEQQFQLLEPEMSQRTLDKIHAVTLPQNTSQPSQLKDRPELRKNTSQDSVGMYSFLNLHSDPSSQASDGLRMLDTTALLQQQKNDEVAAAAAGQSIDGKTRPVVAEEEKESSEEDRRRIMMEEKAAQLRTRLQLAFFKVETRQTNTPFSRLRVPDSHRRHSQSPPPTLPPFRPSLHHRPQSQSVSFPPSERSGMSPEARIAALRAQAAMQLKPAVPSLNSLPMPHITPTAFSARWADDTTSLPLPSSSSHHHSHPNPQRTSSSQADGVNDGSPNIPSSPPVSSRSLHIHEDDTATAARSRVNSSAELDNSPVLLPTPKTQATKSSVHEQQQLSSPPLSQGNDGDEGEEALEIIDGELRPSSRSRERSQPRERRLTSSLVKGEAASGLLQLMRSGAVSAENVRGPMCGL